MHLYLHLYVRLYLLAYTIQMLHHLHAPAPYCFRVPNHHSHRPHPTRSQQPCRPADSRDLLRLADFNLNNKTLEAHCSLA
jgi:hypothetical protein